MLGQAAVTVRDRPVMVDLALPVDATVRAAAGRSISPTVVSAARTLASSGRADIAYR